MATTGVKGHFGSKILGNPRETYVSKLYYTRINVFSMRPEVPLDDQNLLHLPHHLVEFFSSHCGRGGK
jgi:hypothetical protein